jgi:hypothetical protein
MAPENVTGYHNKMIKRILVMAPMQPEVENTTLTRV